MASRWYVCLANSCATPIVFCQYLCNPIFALCDNFSYVPICGLRIDLHHLFVRLRIVLQSQLCLANSYAIPFVSGNFTRNVFIAGWFVVSGCAMLFFFLVKSPFLAPEEMQLHRARSLFYTSIRLTQLPFSYSLNKRPINKWHE